jgi:hypothetical protein
VKSYEDYATKYDGYLNKYLLSTDGELDVLIQQVQMQVSPSDWRKTRENLPDTLAAIFTVWSVSASKEFYKHTKDLQTVLKPHPIQV